jgi:hypothetical protein
VTTANLNAASCIAIHSRPDAPSFRERRATIWRQRFPIPSYFDPSSPARVYLISHPEHRALKIGVAGAHSDRIARHEAHGWELVHEWWLQIGFDALDIEEAVLDRWRNLYSQRPVLSHWDMPQGGASETVRASIETERDTLRFVEHMHRNLMP